MPMHIVVTEKGKNDMPQYIDDEVIERMASEVREITVACGKCEYYKDGSCLIPIDVGCGENEDIMNMCDVFYEKGYRIESETAKKIFDEVENLFSTDGFHLFCSIERFVELKKKYTEGQE